MSRPSFVRGTGLGNLPWSTLLGTADPIAADVSLAVVSGVSVTASSTIHTKGAWSQLTASTPAGAGMLVLSVSGLSVSGSETSCLIDIATGASGSESPMVENIAVGGAPTSGASQSVSTLIMLPVQIASGVRLSARCQALIASDVVNIRYAIYSMGVHALLPTTLDAIGTSTANSRGTAMSGASGSWVEITPSTSRDYRFLSIVPSVLGDVTTTNVTYTLGVGASNSEIEIGRNTWSAASGWACRNYGMIPPLPCARLVPAGSRLAIKHDIGANPGRYAACLVGAP
jgi:hypothetical protein